MAILASGFSLRYQAVSSPTTSMTAPVFDVRAMIEWLKSCGIEAFRNVEGLIEHIKGKCVEFYFRPTYGLASPSVTLGIAELHESIAREVYIETIGVVLHQQAAERLRTLAASEFGWDGADAEPMSLESLASLQVFFQRAGSFAQDFGFFLGYEGEILINWTAQSGELIDMAFFDGRAQLTIDDEELDFDIANPRLYEIISGKCSG